MGVAEYVVYPLLWTYVLLQSFRIYKFVLDNVYLPTIRMFSPRITLAAHALLLVCFIVSSLFAMFPDGVTWKMLVVVYVIITGPTVGCLCFAFFKYYIKFVLTEQRLKIIQNMQGKLNTSFKVVGDHMLRQWTSSTTRRNGIITIVLISFFVILPHIIIVSVGDSDVFDALIADYDEFSDKYWIGIETAVAVIQVAAVAIIIVSLFFKMRLRRNDADMSKMLVFTACASLHIGFWSAICFQGSVIRTRVDKFDFAPLLIWFLPIEATFWFFRGKSTKVRRITVVRAKSTSEYTIQSNLKLQMKEALSDPDGNCIILEIARAEFWVESVLFWNAVNIWSSHHTDEAKLMFAEHIVSMYIQPGCMCEVNVSSKTRKVLVGKIEECKKDSSPLPKDLFSDALGETENLILTHISHQLLEAPQLQKVLSKRRQTKV